MANFCPKCGTATAGAKFCPKCGAQLGTQQPAASPAPPAAMAPPPKGSSALKIVLIVFVLLVVLGVAGVIGGVLFLKRKVHDKVAELKERGVDLPAMVDSARTSHASGEWHDGCLILSRKEAQAVLGFTLTRSDGGSAGSSSNEHCDYYADPAVIQEARARLRNSFNSLRNGHTPEGGDLAKVEEIAKGFSAGANNGSTPILEITIYRGDGKLATSAFNAGSALMGFKGEHLSGPWDEAVFGPLNSTLTVRKGENGAMIDLRQIPDGHKKGLALARVIAPRL